MLVSIMAPTAAARRTQRVRFMAGGVSGMRWFLSLIIGMHIRIDTDTPSPFPLPGLYRSWGRGSG